MLNKTNQNIFMKIKQESVVNKGKTPKVDLIKDFVKISKEGSRTVKNDKKSIYNVVPAGSPIIENIQAEIEYLTNKMNQCPVWDTRTRALYQEQIDRLYRQLSVL